jgi:hypothetical protein
VIPLFVPYKCCCEDGEVHITALPYIPTAGAMYELHSRLLRQSLQYPEDVVIEIHSGVSIEKARLPCGDQGRRAEWDQAK